MLLHLLLWGTEDTRNIKYGVITGFKIIKLDHLRDLFVVKIIVSNLKKTSDVYQICCSLLFLGYQFLFCLNDSMKNGLLNFTDTRPEAQVHKVNHPSQRADYK